MSSGAALNGSPLSGGAAIVELARADAAVVAAAYLLTGDGLRNLP